MNCPRYQSGGPRLWVGALIIIGLASSVHSTASFATRSEFIKSTPATRYAIGDERLGFEIGNGAELIRNLAGKYGVRIPDQWQGETFGAFTEILAPRTEGIPRSRLLVNVVRPTASTPTQLLRTKSERDWTRVELGDFEGIKREGALQNGLYKVEIEVFRGEELIVINLEGRRRQGPTGSESFQRLYDAMQRQTSTN